MSAAIARRALAAARRRQLAQRLLELAPWLAGLAWAWHLGAPPRWLGVAALAVLLAGLAAALRVRRLDRPWLIRALDARFPALQDSSDLLFVPAGELTPLARLQQARVAGALAAQPPDLRAPWQGRRLFASAAAAAVLALLLSWRSEPPLATPDAGSQAAAPARQQSMQATVEVRPPAYTGLPVRRGAALDLQVEEGAEVEWTLRFALAPSAARLRFVDGTTLELEGREGAWRGRRTIDRATLYRVEADAVPLPAAPAAHRIEVTPDRAPQLAVTSPERTLTVLEAGTRRWPLAFEARDDHGLGTVELELTLAQGSGEQVAVSERRLTLRGTGDARRRRYEHRIDLAALGFAPGDDLVARVRARDNRVPTPNESRSASFILRWPPEGSAEGSGVDGLVQKTLPAYFRSQRQIIIDTEALLAQRARLPRDEFVSRSDAIGADQRLLRLRYGEFLGEETEDVEQPDAHDDHDTPGAPPANDAAALMAEAGHLHDIAEAATLLDPQTRALLREALRAMWQAEGELRTGHPDRALPHEQRALERVKQVQQSNRIYLARVGLELPALDPQRRLSGEGPAAGTRADPLAPPPEELPPAEALWRALQHDGATLPLDRMLAWLQARPADDATLPLLAAIDALRQRPDCRRCRATLARQLWPRLRLPAAAPAPRVAPDAMGQAYLDALSPAASR